PYTRALLDALPRIDAGAERELLAIPGQPPNLQRPITGCAFAPRCALADARCGAVRPGLRAIGAGHAACHKAGP
ncbi:MAG: oligopeptide/dipeptide ABC transporter ATP-binding protein, partial [Alphaproteobacteria bacterium]